MKYRHARYLESRYLESRYRSATKRTLMANDALRSALRACYKGRVTKNGQSIRQEDLSAITGISQQQISAYMTGKNEPSLAMIAAIEDACERPRGWILIKAGLVHLPSSVPEAIEQDPNLDDYERRALLHSYQGLIDSKRV